LLIAPKRADDTAFITALRPLVDTINVATMRDANARASADGATPDQVARWLWEKIGK
jgi:osmoprotectant transport system permease protein